MKRSIVTKRDVIFKNMCLDPVVCNNKKRQRKRQKTMGLIKVSTSVVKIYGIFTVFLKKKKS